MRGSPIIGVLNLCSTLTSIHVGTTLQVCFLPFHRYLSAISLIAHFADIKFCSSCEIYVIHSVFNE